MSTSNSLYLRMGGEQKLRAFVGDLYDFMETTEAVSHIRAMHSSDLGRARERLFMFLSGMFGGPALYMQAFGHPRLRQKHLHFSIGDNERDQWLLCAQHAAEQLDLALPLREELMLDLTVMANHLRNTDVSAQPCTNAASSVVINK